MSRRDVDKRLQQVVEEAERILRRWQYSVAADGGLQIHPTGPRLQTEELGGFLRLLTDVFASEPPREIVFDMSAVRYLGPNWTLALAMFIDFAQSVGAPCRIDGARGQPAAAAAMYHRSPQVRALLSERDGTPLDSARRSA